MKSFKHEISHGDPIFRTSLEQDSRRAERNNQLHDLIEWKLIDLGVLALHHNTNTWLSVEYLDVDSGPGVVLEYKVNVIFDDIDAVSKALISDEHDEEFSSGLANELSQQIRRQIEAIKECDQLG